ncbi:MAG: UDP-N-acetylmuramoyl-L-alanine--D-glutamate ligase [Ignavibacteriales bacterium]
MDWLGKKVAVVGMGLSNVPLARYLVHKGASVTGFDRKDADGIRAAYDELSRLGVDFSLGPGYLDRLVGFHTVFLTPGMKKDLPQIIAARESGSEISSETRLFFDLCRATIVGVTGSAGKTTTTTLTGEFLKRDGTRRVWVGGNIGNPLIEKVEEIPVDSIVVLELSSFQLQTVDRSPGVSIITNISPNHLDVHSSMDEYIEAKKNIFRFQSGGDVAVLNADNPVTAGMAGDCPAGVLMFSRRNRASGAYVDGGRIVLGFGGGESVIPVKDIRIPGLHNVENALAASTAAAWLGAKPGDIAAVLRTFPGVEHRLELVREKDGVRFYNDSIATAPDRTIAALNTIEGPKVLILGGYDKHLPFDELGREVVDKVEAVVTVGATAAKIEKAIEEAAAAAGKGPLVTRCSTFAEAVEAAAARARPGCSVLLSPACASYDLFRNFEERGRLFKELVTRL